jgi:hypothetical protein
MKNLTCMGCGLNDIPGVRNLPHDEGRYGASCYLVPYHYGKLRRPPDFIPVWACRLRFSCPADDTGTIICFPHNNYENDNFSLYAR